MSEQTATQLQMRLEFSTLAAVRRDFGEKLREFRREMMLKKNGKHGADWSPEDFVARVNQRLKPEEIVLTVPQLRAIESGSGATGRSMQAQQNYRRILTAIMETVAPCARTMDSETQMPDPASVCIAYMQKDADILLAPRPRERQGVVVMQPARKPHNAALDHVVYGEITARLLDALNEQRERGGR